MAAPPLTGPERVISIGALDVPVSVFEPGMPGMAMPLRSAVHHTLTVTSPPGVTSPVVFTRSEVQVMPARPSESCTAVVAAAVACAIV